MYNNYNSIGLTNTNHGAFGNPHPQYTRPIHQTILVNGTIGNYTKIASITLGSNGLFTGRYNIFTTGNYSTVPFGELNIRIYCINNTPTTIMSYMPLTKNYPSPFQMFASFYNIANNETTIDIYAKFVSNNSNTLIESIFTDYMYQATWSSEFKSRERIDLDFLLDNQTSDTITNIQTKYSNSPIYNTVNGIIQLTGTTTTDLPTASESLRGTMIQLQKNNSTDDELYLCVRKADNTYTWKSITLT